jgi:hypothetical protein
MTGASAAARAIDSGRARRPDVRSLQELHGKAPAKRRSRGRGPRLVGPTR